MGKEEFNKALNGGSHPADAPCVQRGLLAELRSEGRALRWVATSVLPELHDTMVADSGRKWPEATVFHHMWTMVEDACVEAWIEFARKLSPSHLSLHFDGIRIDSASVPDRDAFAKESARHIQRSIGVEVVIVEKVHRTFLELLRPADASLVPTHGTALEANCLPVALPHLRGDLA